MAGLAARAEGSIPCGVQQLTHPASTFSLSLSLFPALTVGVGAYRNSEGSPWVLPVVSKAEAHLGHSFAGRKLNHEYLPMDGLDAFTMLASSLVLGSDSSVLADKRAVGIQALGGTGALRLAAEFLGEFHGDGEVYISDPSWPNHVKIFQSAGLSTCTYRYYGADRGLDFAGMVADLQAAKQGSVVVLHACAHNPTGLDPNFEQWQELGRLCKVSMVMLYVLGLFCFNVLSVLFLTHALSMS